MTIIKYIYDGKKRQDSLFVDIKKDRLLFKRVLKSKKIIVVGRGITGGKPIGKTFGDININYITLLIYVIIVN